MPVLTVQMPADSLTSAQKRAIIEKVTDAYVEATGFEALRPSVHVLIEEVSTGGYGVGGHVLDVDAVKARLAAAAAASAPSPAS